MSDEDQKPRWLGSTDLPSTDSVFHRVGLFFIGGCACVGAVFGLSLLAYLLVVGDLVVEDFDTMFMKFFYYFMFSPYVFLHIGIVVGLSWFGYVVYRVFFYKDATFQNGFRSAIGLDLVQEPRPLSHVSLVYATILVVIALLQAKVLLNGGWDVAEMYEAFKLSQD